MNKKLLYLLIFLFYAGLSAQSNLDFREIKTKFETHRNLLNNEFDKKITQTKDPITKSLMDSQKILFLKKLDSIENAAYVGTLVKVKNMEDLSKIFPKENNQETIDVHAANPDQEKAAEYPGGFDILRKQVAENIYTENIINEDKTMLKTNIAFVVERDGSISSVKAIGSNETFNRQAIIAVYLLSDKFSPGIYKGFPVRSHYKMPLTLNFE